MSRARQVPAEDRFPDERGTASVELVLLVPALVLVLCVLVAGWRLWSARTEVRDASAAAARAATLETSGSAAAARARQVATADLDVLGVRCDPLGVDVDTSGFATAPGTTADVRVAIDCRVDLADLLVAGLPGHWQVSGNATQRMDTFRERTP